MNESTRRRKVLKSTLATLLSNNQDAHLVENRYRTLRYCLMKEWPTLESYGKETLLEILKDVVYLDRQIRAQTEGEQNNLKKELSDDYVEKELNFTITP